MCVAYMNIDRTVRRDDRQLSGQHCHMDED